MTDTRTVNNDLTTDEELFVFLANKDYKGLMRAIDKDYRLRFSTEQSGDAFDDCIDWCAQNAGGLEPAKQVLLELFNNFYRQLPVPVRDNLAHLAEEIGYSLPNVVQLKHRSTEKDAPPRKAFNVMVKQVQDYMAEIRERRQAQVSARFHEPAVATVGLTKQKPLAS
jgi:hypothetical protein